MGTGSAVLRATNELLSIINHTGLNSDENAFVDTAFRKGRLISFVSGVDVVKMQEALTKFFEGRVYTAKIDSTRGVLVVVQSYRE